jgi:hypothetical protein
MWLVAAGVAFAASPRVAVACSCVQVGDLRAYADEGSVILEGHVLAREGDGVRVAVDHWYAGPGRAPAVILGGDFDRPGVSSSCSVGSPPAVGSAWVWVAFRDPQTGVLSVINCTPSERWVGPVNALHDQAVAAFGPGWTPVVVAPGDPDPVPIAAALVVVAAGLAALLAAILVARRRSA